MPPNAAGQRCAYKGVNNTAETKAARYGPGEGARHNSAYGEGVGTISKGNTTSSPNTWKATRIYMSDYIEGVTPNGKATGCIAGPCYNEPRRCCCAQKYGMPARWRTSVRAQTSPSSVRRRRARKPVQTARASAYASARSAKHPTARRHTSPVCSFTVRHAAKRPAADTEVQAC